MTVRVRMLIRMNLWFAANLWVVGLVTRTWWASAFALLLAGGSAVATY